MAEAVADMVVLEVLEKDIAVAEVVAVLEVVIVLEVVAVLEVAVMAADHL